MTVSVYAVQSITDRTEIDKDDLAAITTGEMFGYEIESIGDIDGDGIIDLATTSFEFDDTYTKDADGDGDAKYGLVTILFMNNDGSVKSTKRITIDSAGTGLGTACLDDPTRGGVGDDILARDERTLEDIVFMGDLDGDGEKTIAISMTEADFQGDNSQNGGVFMVELNSDGSIDNCKRITEGEGNFTPDTTYYRTGTDKADFGWGTTATDVNNDGKNELIVSASNNADTASNIWVFFLNNDGSVATHSTIPIRLINDLGETKFLDSMATVDGKGKIAVGVNNKVYIVNLNTDGTYSSSSSFTAASIDPAIDAAARFGSDIAAIEDVNGDGVKDILVGALFAHDNDNTGDTGAAYIINLNADDTVLSSIEITNDSEFTRTGSKFLAASDYFGNGLTLWKTSGTTAVFAIGAHNDDTGGTNNGAIHLFSFDTSVASTASGGGGSGDEHKSRPTFGRDYNTFVQRVDTGLAINNQNFTVTDNYWTPMELLELKVGVTQNFTATVFAPRTLYIMEFVFGIPEVGDWSNSEASIEIYTNYDGEALDFKINDNEISPIINATSLEYSASRVKCVADDKLEPCYSVSVEFSFNESPIGKVLALQAIDYSRMNQILYFNDGLDITGDSLNPSVIKQIQSEIKYKGLQTVQRIDKENNIWMSMDKSEPVLLYKQNDVGSFFAIEYRTFETMPDKMTSNIDRQHSEFSKSLEFEINRALEKFGYLTSYKQIQGDDLTNYVAKQTQYTHTSRADNPVLQQDMKDEATRAQELLVELLSKTHYASLINNNSHVGILDEFTTDDRTIGEILAEERITKKIKAQELSHLKQVLSTKN